MLRTNGITTFKPSRYSVELIKTGDAKPFFWPSGQQVQADELVIGKTYLVDESDRTLVPE